MIKRIFDFIIAFIALLVLLPLMVAIAIAIKISSKGTIFYRQTRVGKNNMDFFIFKFRTMQQGADKGSLLTVGNSDPRVTRIGLFLRKYKLDELPQLINVILGDMSLVGPRPEVRKFVNLYNKEQQKVLEVRPGITDLASIAYSNENQLLGEAADPEKKYIEEIMPAKLQMNLKYIREQGFITDIRIIFTTMAKILNRD